MKKLSEIGRGCFVGTYGDGEFQVIGENKASAWVFSMEGITIEPAKVLTLEERRELVRLVWEAARAPCQCSDPLCECVSASVEDWIKEQGI